MDNPKFLYQTVRANVSYHHVRGYEVMWKAAFDRGTVVIPAGALVMRIGKSESYFLYLYQEAVVTIDIAHLRKIENESDLF